MEYIPQYKQDQAATLINDSLNLEVSYFWIHGMSCPRCVERVTLALFHAPGVYNAIIEFPDGLAEITYNPNQVTVDGLILVVQAAGDGGHHQYLAQWIE